MIELMYAFDGSFKREQSHDETESQTETTTIGPTRSIAESLSRRTTDSFEPVKLVSLFFAVTIDAQLTGAFLFTFGFIAQSLVAPQTSALPFAADAVLQQLPSAVAFS